MTDSITPPIELVQQWMTEARSQDYFCITEQVAHRAAQWGADQELEACIDWISVYTGLEHPELLIELLRAARRPSLKSLKEQALQELDKVDMLWATEEFGQETLNSLNTIRKALEALPDD